MTDTLCAACGRPCPDGYACSRCAEMTGRDLAAVPGLGVELDVTLTRQDRIGEPGGSGGRRAVEPLPYSTAASAVGWTLTNTVTTWCRHVMEQRGEAVGAPQPGPGAANAARWLLGHVEWLRHRPEAAEAFEEIQYAVAQARIVIDQRTPRWYAGPCGADLYGLPGAEVIRCRECGTEFDAEARREWLLAAADDTLAHAELIGRAAAALGVEISPADVRWYAASGQIVAHGVSRAGSALYRFGDVLEVARNIAARKAARALVAAGQKARRAARGEERDKSA
jgi:hypothetical protein